MSEARKLTRDEIWQRIRETSKQEFILAEMKRLGFWPKDSAEPTLAERFMEERTQLESRLRKLGAELAQVQDPEEAIKLLHKERKAAALERREHTRRKRNAERFARASRWHQHQADNISYVGDGAHFASLAGHTLDHPRLATQSLPLIGGAAELARAMGITINELRFLCFQRDVSNVSHYQRFTVPKKSGGERLISAPMPRLKRAQYWLLENILNKVPVTDRAHGFVKDRNILSNALPHVGKPVVVNLDLENFFPSIGYVRVKGVYRKLGYSEEVATLCALLSTEAPVESYELDGQRWYVKTGSAVLPQGAPTSPALTNILCRRLDKRLRGAAAKLGFEYTRYADDLTFSSATPDNLGIKKLLWRVRKIVDSEGLKIHSGKTRVMRKHQRQEVTGVVVNDKPSVCREELRKFRALLFQIEKDGPEGKTWRTGSLFRSIEGYANFVAMVNPEKGKPLQKRVGELWGKHFKSAPRPAIPELNSRSFRAAAAAGKAPRENWWQAQPKPPPVLELTAAEIAEQKRAAKAAERAAAEAAEQAARPQSTREQRASSSQTPPSSSSSPAREAWRAEQRERRVQNSGGDKLPTWAWWLIAWLIIVIVRQLTK